MEADIETLWSGLMLRLCSRHRINARNGRPTDYRIGDLREDHYRGYEDVRYFTRLLQELARRHPEIQVDGDIIRLTRHGLDNCGRYDRTFQRDFQY